MSIFLESGTIVACVAPEEVSAPTRKHTICGTIASISEYTRPEEKSRVLEKLSCKAILWKNPTVLPVLAPHTLVLFHLASMVDEMHCDNLQKTLDFSELRLS